VRGDRVVRLPLYRRRGAHEELEVACRRDAEHPTDLAFDVAQAVGVRSLEVEELLDGRGGHGDSLRAATDTDVRGAIYAPRMSRSGLDADTALDVLLSATCGRHRYARDAAAVVDELRRAAGDRADILARVAGSWVGFYGDDHTRTLCKALLEIPGALDWVGHGRARRDAGSHGAPMVRP